MSDTASSISSMFKLEKAYIIILPPSSPAGSGMGAALGIAASEGATAASSELQSQSGPGDSGEGASYGNSALSSAESSVGGNVANKVTFLFNPQQYSVERSATWNRNLDPGAWSTSIPQFLGAGPRVLSLEVFLDATYSENGGVQPDVDLLMKCLTPTAMSLIMGKPSPPFCLFGWGSTISFLACMLSVRAEYQMFRADGTPLRAACQITLEEIPVSMAGQNPTSGGIPRRTRTTVAGDTLQSVAYREYGKPTMWRAIARANGIEDPMRLAPGTTLLIPPPSEASALA